MGSRAEASRQSSDILALCKEAGVAPDQYQVFSGRRSRTPPKTSSAQRDEAAIRSGSGPSPKDLRAEAGLDAVMAQMLPAAPPAAPSYSPSAAPASPTTAWSALESALPRRASHGDASALLRIQQASVAFFPMGGGVGITSIMATLARMAEQSGTRYGLVEPTGPSLLRHYFSSRSPASLNLVTGPASPGGSDAWLWSGLRGMQEAVDRLLIDAGPHLSPQAIQWCSAAGLRIAVLQPDLRCVLRLTAWMESLQREEQDRGQGLTVAILLNRYDPSVAVHSEIRARLEQQYGGSVISTPIRASEQVTVALARGGTVLDFDHEGGIADDYRRVFRWMEDRGYARAAAV